MTAITLDRPATKRSQWFASWFDSVHYHKLYAYRDDAEAGRFIDGLLRQLRPDAGSRVLDLGCGAGRHAKHLAAKGFDVTGIDLSADSIMRAQQFVGPHLRFVRQDMRAPFGRDSFDYVFNLFTSFGYFDDPDEHLGVVGNIARSLSATGTLVLDYLNVRYADAHMVPDEVRTIDGVTYRLTRWSDGTHFCKRIIVDDPHRSERLQQVERVARFTLPDFHRMFALNGLVIEAVHGDYRLSPYDAVSSPRLILVARKAGVRRESVAASVRRSLPREALSDAADRLG